MDLAGDDSFGPEQVEQETKRDKVPFSTELRPSLYERLRAAAFWEDTSIAGLTFDSVATDELQEMVDKNFELYKKIVDNEAFGKMPFDFLFDRTFEEGPRRTKLSQGQEV